MINVLIPAAGIGSRYATEGYPDIKPLIPVKGCPMIEWVVSNFVSNIVRPHFTFIFQKSQVEAHNVEHRLDRALSKYNISWNIVQIDGLTDGSARTVLHSKGYLVPNIPVIVANSDQWVENFKVEHFIGKSFNTDVNIMTFTATDRKWSFVRSDDQGFVSEVVEKEPISDKANVGVFFYQNQDLLYNSIEKMIAAEKKVKNEYYLAPSINELISEGKVVKHYHLGSKGEKFHGLGLPSDLREFLATYKGDIQ